MIYREYVECSDQTLLVCSIDKILHQELTINASLKNYKKNMKYAHFDINKLLNLF